MVKKQSDGEIPEDQAKRLAAKPPIAFVADSLLSMERQRVRVQVRQSHLALNGQSDSETDEILKRLVQVEEYLTERLATFVEAHPAFPWFSRVKGIGRENIGKVVGLIDISKANSPSSLWKFAGYHVVDGRAPKPIKGEKLTYNSRLRTMCWRLGGGLMKAKGCFYDYYSKEKTKYQERFQRDGYTIKPELQITKAERENGKVISEGRIHNMALRKMIKLFLSLLWNEWRKGTGLPTRVPYPIEYLGHTSIIEPEQMTDRPAKSPKRTRKTVKAEKAA